MDRHPTAPFSFRPIATITVAVIAALALAGCGRAAPASVHVRTGPASGDAVRVAARDNAFSPETIAVEPGSETTVEVRNEGEAAHNLVIEELGVSSGTIQPGQTVTMTFQAPVETLTYVCTFHRGMTGKLVPR